MTADLPTTPPLNSYFPLYKNKQPLSFANTTHTTSSQIYTNTSRVLHTYSQVTHFSPTPPQTKSTSPNSNESATLSTHLHHHIPSNTSKFQINYHSKSTLNFQIPTVMTFKTTTLASGKFNPTITYTNADLLKAMQQMQPQKLTKDLCLEYQYPCQPHLPQEIDFHINDYSQNQQLTRRFQTTPPHTFPLPFGFHSDYLRKLAQARDDSILLCQHHIHDETEIIQPLDVEHFRFPAPLYIQYPMNPSPTDCCIYYTEQQLGVYALLNEHVPTFTYIDLDNHQQILKPTYFFIHTSPSTDRPIPPAMFFKPAYLHPHLYKVHIAPSQIERPLNHPFSEFLLPLPDEEKLAIFRYLLYLTLTIAHKDQAIVQQLRINTADQPQINRYLHRPNGNLTFHNLSDGIVITLTWIIFHT